MQPRDYKGSDDIR